MEELEFESMFSVCRIHVLNGVTENYENSLFLEECLLLIQLTITGTAEKCGYYEVRVQKNSSPLSKNI